jgi:hypothetical protein
VTKNNDKFYYRDIEIEQPKQTIEDIVASDDLGLLEDKPEEKIKFAFDYSEKELEKHITNTELDNFVKNAKFNLTASAYNYPIPRRSGKDWHLYISIQKPTRMGSLHNTYWVFLYKNNDEGKDEFLYKTSFQTLKEAKRFVALNYYFETQRIYDVIEMEKETPKQTIEDIIESDDLGLLDDDKEPKISFTDKEDGAVYTVEQDEKGVWTIFSESPNWERRNEYPSGFASKEDAISIAKLDAGIEKEIDPEGAFMWENEKESEEPEESIENLIEGLKILLEYSEGAEKEELENTIEGLKLLL